MTPAIAKSRNCTSSLLKERIPTLTILSNRSGVTFLRQLYDLLRLYFSGTT
jgi:hypothetical protein